MVVIFLQEANCKYHMTDRLPRYFSSQSLFFCLATDRDRVLRVLTVLSQFDSGDNPASSALGDHGRLTATSTPGNKSYSRTNVLSVCRSHVCLIHTLCYYINLEIQIKVSHFLLTWWSGARRGLRLSVDLEMEIEDEEEDCAPLAPHGECWEISETEQMLGRYNFDRGTNGSLISKHVCC